jgi:hypothetical protein
VANGSRFASSDRVDGLVGMGSVGINDQWRKAYDDGNTGQGGSGQYPPRQDSSRSLFTPLVGRSASAYPANESNPDGNRPITPAFLAEMQHGVGVYEFNMRVTSGAFRQQGSVVNRYS